MPPELEAKLIAPDEMRLPDLNGLVDAATAVRLPERYLRPSTAKATAARVASQITTGSSKVPVAP